MTMMNIHGEHAQAGTGRIYKYRALFEGHGPDVLFKGQIPIVERGKVLRVERVLFVDSKRESAVDGVHRAMRKIIDETEFMTVDVD
jgi:hypothetical protein